MRILSFRQLPNRVLVALFSFILLAISLSYVGFDVSRAQTQRSRSTATPTPTPKVSPKVTVSTPTPTPKPIAAPTISTSPTPVDDDGGIIPVFSEEVLLNVRVVDRGNRVLGSLKQSDFTIFEDNVKQDVSSFSQQEVPINYSLVIDNSGSLRSQLEKVIDASKVIVATNKPDDETCVIRFIGSDKITVLQDFTSDQKALNEILEEGLFSEGGQTAVVDAVYLAAEKEAEYEKSKNPNDKKRRAIILVTDGEDRDSFYDEKQLFELLREADVQIYPIGFVGDLDKEGGLIRKSPQAKAMALLNRMATETGGKAYFPTSVSDLDGIAKDIAKELRTQYLLSYVPKNDKQDGTYRAIKVALSDGPNKQKRIAITRSGRTANLNKEDAPKLQKPPK